MKKKETNQAAEEMRVCDKCGAEKPMLTGFYTAKGCRDGYDKTCKDCRNAAGRERKRKKREAEAAAPLPQKPEQKSAAIAGADSPPAVMSPVLDGACADCVQNMVAITKDQYIDFLLMKIEYLEASVYDARLRKAG